MKVVNICILVTQLADLVSTQTDSNSDSRSTCKDILQGYMTGQMTAALGSLQVENLRKEFQRLLENQGQEIALLKKGLAELATDEGFANNITTSYVIWGKKKCPSHADTVYSGYVGGEYYTHKGGAAEPLCLPKDPEWGLHTDVVDPYKSYVYGAEYQVKTLPDSRKSLHHHDVPCAVCGVSKRSSTMMIPARRNCYDGWYKEYQGYLMAGYYDHNRASKYICIDEHPDTLPGGQAIKDGYLLYAVEGRCGSLPCPPYVEGRELTCVVCSQ